MLRLILASLLALSTGALAAEKDILLGVNEGTSGSVDYQQRQAKYKGFADYLGGVLKAQVKLESAQDLKSLNNNLKNARYDFLLVRPCHISAKAMRDQHYVLVSAAKGEAITSFIVHKDSPLKKPADIAGKSIVMPDENAYPTHVALAMLKKEGIKPETQNIRNMRNQEGVGYAVEQKLADVGVVVSYSKVAKEWEKKGHRFLWQSKPLPFWSIIASPKMSPDDVAKVREALLKLDTVPNGPQILKDMGVSGFVAGNQEDYASLLGYLGE